jgi:hypothetical protein
MTACEKYRKVTSDLREKGFSYVRSKWYGDLCGIVNHTTPKGKELIDFVEK